jgi:hypothetical protein
MFNDLNNPNQTSRPAVDDIFAETDKPSTNGNQSDIETRRVGLNATGESLPPFETEPSPSNKNTLKIIVIVILALAILGGIYFAYLQLSKNKDENNTVVNTAVTNTVKTTVTTTTNSQKEIESEFVSVIPGVSTSSSFVNASGTAMVGSFEMGTGTVSVITTEPKVESVVDSDSDGLTDSEEVGAGTNINVIDTDNDGLSDYEEVKIYRSNPLNADTDADGYLDGVEVKGGYDPNSTGKLPGNTLK